MPGERRFVPKTDLTVSTTAVKAAEANNSRIGLILQETGGQAVRIGASDQVSTTHGLVLVASSTMLLEGSLCPTDAVWAIRDGGSDGTLVATEILAS